MKKLLKEKQVTKDADKINIKRYFYDPLKPNHVVIEQVQKTGKTERIISEFGISLENAPREIQEMVNE